VRTTNGKHAHGVGTMLTRARVAGGRVVQASTRGPLVPSAAGRRLPWAHYLAVPGTVEVVGWRGAADAAVAFADGGDPGPHLDPGAASDNVLARLQASSVLDGSPAIRARRTRLRWAAAPGTESGTRRSRPGMSGEFVLTGETIRTLRIRVPEGEDLASAAVAALCEDIGFHDWLLTTVAAISHRIGESSDDAAVLHRLRPAVDHLLHLWMPGGSVPPGMSAAWEAIDADLGLTRQWRSCVDRVRDFMAMRALERMTG
jgi:hypothetical protein